VRFVYPFLFEPEDFEALVRTAEQAQWPGPEGTAFQVWTPARFPEADLLAHVRNHLNPPEGKVPTARLWTMEARALQSPSALGTQAQWELVHPHGWIPFQITGVQLLLFRVGVGFVTVEATPRGDTLKEWLDYLHYFRFIRGQREVKVRVSRRQQQGSATPFFPEPAGGLEKHPEGEGEFGDVLEAVLATARPSTRVNTRWEEVFVPGQLLPFAVVYADREVEPDRPLLLYRLRHFFHSQQEIHPVSEELRPDHPSLLPYAEGQWFTFSLEGGAFLACDAPKTDFFRATLPDHLRQTYFLVFLLALLQRFTLMRLSQEVAEHWLRGHEAERIQHFERIRDELLEFTARGYFTQVMQQEHYHRAYRKWQEVFQIERLYQEVKDEVAEMHEYLLAEQTQRLERRLNLLGALIGMPALVLSFLSINLYGITARDEGLPLGLALLISIGVSILLGAIMLRLLQWQTHKGR